MRTYGYPMPDGSILYAEDGGKTAAIAWAMEAINEFREVNIRLERIEAKLEAIDVNTDSSG